jgi:hypothetical protein
MLSEGFELAIPEIKLPKTQALNSASEGIGLNKFSLVFINLLHKYLHN